jgi:hypothetical protein
LKGMKAYELGFLCNSLDMLIDNSSTSLFMKEQLSSIPEKKIKKKLSELKEWKALSLDIRIPSSWRDLTPVKLAKSLSMKNGHHMKIPPSLFKLSDTYFMQQLILGYYKSIGKSYSSDNRKLTKEQYEIIHPSENQNIRIIQGAPGSGKTFTIIEHLYQRVKTGKTCLVITFTTAAATVIRDRCASNPALVNSYRMLKFDHKFKTINQPPILITTIDKIARYIVTGDSDKTLSGGGDIVGYREPSEHVKAGKRVDFENIATRALNVLINNQQAIRKFWIDDRPMCNEIIVDESQTLTDTHYRIISEIRSQLSVETINIKNPQVPLMFFCDPKQIISSNSGDWLKKIFSDIYKQKQIVKDVKSEMPIDAYRPWTINYARAQVDRYAKVKKEFLKLNSKTPEYVIFHHINNDGNDNDNGYPVHTRFGVIFKYNLSTTFRFKTQEMVDHVMRISKKRPELHIDFVPNSIVPAKEDTIVAKSISDLEDIVAEISLRISRGKSIGVFSPSTGKTNAHSKQIDSFILLLKKNDIPFCSVSEFNYKGAGVTISTYQSCAGMEFDHTYIFGASRYPSRYSMVIDNEIGRSLIFIVNSRAKETLTYVLDSDEICSDVDISTIKTASALTTYSIPDNYKLFDPVYWTSDMLYEEGDGYSYMNLNGVTFKSKKQVIDKNITQYDFIKILNCGDGKSEDFNESSLSMSHASAKRSNYSSSSKITPNIAIKKGMITRGVKVGNSEIALPDSKSFKEIYYYCLNKRIETKDASNSTLIKYLNTIYNISASIFGRKELDLKLKGASVHICTIDSVSYAYCPDMFCYDAKTKEKIYVTYTDNYYIAAHPAIMDAIVNKKKQTEAVIMVDGGSGTFYHFTVNEDAIIKYKYHLGKLKLIHNFVVNRKLRDSILEKTVKYEKATFAVDTEFVRSKDVYEVGMLNLRRPYLSISTYVKTPNLERDIYRPISMVTYNAVAISAENLYLRVKNSMSSSSITEGVPIFTYFSAKQDYLWYNNASLSGSCKAIDFEEASSSYTTKVGTFRGTGSDIKLECLYQTTVGKFNPSLQHTALFDAILLGEIMLSRKF